MIKRVINSIVNRLSSVKKKRLKHQYWQSKNEHNNTIIGSNTTIEDIDLINIGNHTYGPVDVLTFALSDIKLYIGSFCSIAQNVKFLTAGEHILNCISSFPIKNYFNTDYKVNIKTSKGDIVVDDDVWIGYGATILSGVHIGQGAVIGANTTVAKDVPPYAIYAGNRIVRYRFPEDTIEKLIKFDYNKLTEEDIKNNMDLLYKEIDDNFFETDFYKTHLKDE